MLICCLLIGFQVSRLQFSLVLSQSGKYILLVIMSYCWGLQIAQFDDSGFSFIVV